MARNGVCASACFFIWMNGAKRDAYGIDVLIERERRTGPVGLHRPFLVNPKNEEASLKRQADVIRGVTSYLETNLIPRRLIDEMMSRPSNDIYWLTFDDLDELGESPPALEELYLSKCMANTRQLHQQDMAARHNHDAGEVARIRELSRSTMPCTTLLNFEAHDAAIEKLARGWVPRSPFRIKQ